MTMNSSQQAVLTGVVKGKIRWNAPLSEWTTYRIGGPADALVTLLDVQDLQEVLVFCQSQNLPWKLLGRGSNILASDYGFRGIVVVLGEGFKYIGRHDSSEAETTCIRMGAAVTLPKLSNWCADNGLSGFEFASGIPGTVGGAVTMNAGAWGRSMADVISEIEVVDLDKIEIISGKNLTFGYRQCPTLAYRKSAVVSAAKMVFKPENPEQIRETVRTLKNKRKERQPYGLPSGGSVFKNSEDVSAGRLIEEAGFKGRRIGDAEVSEKHANFIVNRGKATADEVLALMDEIKEKVFKTTGIELIPEVEFLGWVNH